MQRSLAADLFNYCWELIEKEDRTEQDADLMINAAYASRFFWKTVGEPVNHARGEWQISRAYAVAGRAEPALHHARWCLEICETNGIGDFDLGYAYEALARAHAVAGDTERTAEWLDRARGATAGIADDDDRELLERDLESIHR